jgi:hypothetical protein
MGGRHWESRDAVVCRRWVNMVPYVPRASRTAGTGVSAFNIMMHSFRMCGGVNGVIGEDIVGVVKGAGVLL